MPLQDLLLEIERELWRNDARLYERHLHDNALLVFAETGPMDKTSALRAIEQENAEGRRWEDVNISDARVVEVTNDAAMLTYRADARRAHGGAAHAALASSLYARHGGQWKLAFHQQSPLNGKAMASHQAARAATRHGAAALGAVAIGALATGAAAIGALAVGRLAIGALALKRGHIGSLTIDELEVRRLHVDDAVPER